jgi:hypothetical protein
MKSFQEIMVHELPRRLFLVMAILITIAIVIDAALHTSHIMVFFALIVLSILFYSIYVESEKHSLGASIVCLILGSLYLAFSKDFSWDRFLLYTATFYISAISFLASWLITKQTHHT